MAQMYKLDPVFEDLNVEPETTMYKLPSYHEQLSTAPSGASTSAAQPAKLAAPATSAAPAKSTKAEKKEKAKDKAPAKDKAAPAPKEKAPTADGPAKPSVANIIDGFKKLTLEEKSVKLDNDISVLVEQMREFKKQLGLQMKEMKAAKEGAKPEKKEEKPKDKPKNDGKQHEKKQKADGKAKDNQQNEGTANTGNTGTATNAPKPTEQKAEGKKHNNPKSKAKTEKKEAVHKHVPECENPHPQEADAPLLPKFSLELTVSKKDGAIFDTLVKALKERGVDMGPNPSGNKVVKVKVADSDTEPVLIGDAVLKPTRGRVAVWSHLNALVFSPQGNISQLLEWLQLADDVLSSKKPVQNVARTLNQHIQVQDFLASSESPTIADFIWLPLIANLPYVASTTELWVRAVPIGGHKRGE